MRIYFISINTIKLNCHFLSGRWSSEWLFWMIRIREFRTLRSVSACKRREPGLIPVISAHLLFHTRFRLSLFLLRPRPTFRGYLHDFSLRNTAPNRGVQHGGFCGTNGRIPRKCTVGEGRTKSSRHLWNITWAYGNFSYRMERCLSTRLGRVLWQKVTDSLKKIVHNNNSNYNYNNIHEFFLPIINFLS